MDYQPSNPVKYLNCTVVITVEKYRGFCHHVLRHRITAVVAAVTNLFS